MVNDPCGSREKEAVTDDIDGCCRYGLFNRHHGESEAPFDSLNVGLSVGDRESNVRANRVRIKNIMTVSRLVSARQVHDDRIYCLTDAPNNDLEVDGFDAIITNLRNVGLMIQHADCQAVLLFDAGKQVVAAVHCGWRGSVLDLPAKTIACMCREYGTDPADLQAVISPSLGPCCAEFVHHEKELPASFRNFMVRENHFDFWQITRHQLTASGVPPAGVIMPTVCTSCSPDYFSYRRARRNGDGTTGRNCSVIALFARDSHITTRMVSVHE